MRETWGRLHAEMEKSLLDLDIRESEIIPFCQNAIRLIREFLDRLKADLLEHEFSDAHEEITFFKQVKPAFVSKLIYHCEVLNIESKRPPGNKESNLGYYNNELKRINQFVTEHLVFWQYQTLKDISLDAIYFTRKTAPEEVSYDPLTIDQDKVFSTSHDFVFAKLAAYDELSIYLHDVIKGVEENASLKQKKKDKMVWTGSKAALIELIYGLHSCGVINNGNVEVKQIAAFFEEQLNVKVGNWYRAFQDMRERKANRTIFIDQLKKKVLERMETTDND